MNDLINRQAAIDALVEELAHRPEGYWDSGLNRYDVEVVLSQQPSVDAVEVVRCEDCIWRYHDVIDGEETDWCGVWANETELDAFCKYGKGKRKDD